MHLSVQALDANTQAWKQKERARDTLHMAGAEQDNGEQTGDLNEATGAAVLPGEDPADPGAPKGMHG